MKRSPTIVPAKSAPVLSLMKLNYSIYRALALIAVAFATSLNTGSAQFFAKDDASNYTNSPGNSAWVANNLTTNGGFGFTPWTYTKGGSGAQGYYLGNGGRAASIMVSNKFWGMYANNGGGSSVDNVAVAYRGFTNSMPVNTVFKIKWQPIGIGFDSSHFGGFSLRNGNANSTTGDYFTNLRFAFYYIGGGADSYVFADGSGGGLDPTVTQTGLGFGTAPLDIEFTLLTANRYRLVVKDGTGANTLFTIDNQPLFGSGTIDSAALFAVQTDGDQLFNSMEISSTSLVPPDIQNVTPANGSIYVDTSSAQVNFDVLSSFSTVATNQIKLTLNGVNQTNLTFSGFPTNRHVVLTSALLGNVTYNGVITAQDANGNRATNTFTFNTWRPDCPFIEAEDYNFTGGHFIRDSFPDSFNGYAGLLGSNGVDYLEYDTFGVTNAYRTGDFPQLETAVDADHAAYAANSYIDYN